MATNEILNEREAAEFLRQKPRTIRQWRRRGLPHCKVTAKTIIYRRTDLLDWLGKFRVAIRL